MFLNDRLEFLPAAALEGRIVDKRCCGNYGVQQHRAVRTGTPLLKTIQSSQQYGMSGGEHPLQHHKSVGQRWRHGKDFRHERSRGCRGTDWSMQNIFSGILNDLLQNMADGFKKMEVSDPSSLTDFIEATSGSILSIISVRHLSSLNCWEPLSLESEQCSVQQRPGRHSNHWSGRCRQSPLWHRHPRGEESSLKNEDEPNENLSWKWIFRETLIFLKTHKWLLRQML